MNFTESISWHISNGLLGQNPAGDAVTSQFKIVESHQGC